MSHRECAGFNRPGFTVSAEEPVDVGPKSAHCACRDKLVNDTPSEAPALFALRLRSRNCSAVPPASLAAGVAQPLHSTWYAWRASWSMRTRFRPLLSVVCVAMPGVSFQSRVAGVVHPYGTKEEAAADVRGTDARSAQIGGRDAISQCFQVSLYNAEPRPASRARNLLSKEHWREALGDEGSPDRPEVAVVGEAPLLAGDGEGLTGATPGPDFGGVGHACEAQSVGPDTDAGEEVGLDGVGDVGGGEVEDGSLKDGTFGYVSGIGQVSEPLARECVDFVVDGAHSTGSRYQAPSVPNSNR